MVAAAVPLLDSAPGVRLEFDTRLRCICDQTATPWTPFGRLTPAEQQNPLTAEPRHEP